MKFDELNEDNYILFAIRHYDNPRSTTKEDFYDDLKRFRWIKKSIKRYKNLGEINVPLLINHFIILYNTFGDAATPLLFYKISPEYWSIIKTFVVYLGRLPDSPKTEIHNIPIDIDFLKKLNSI
jgi:hypothetical protein